MAVDNLGLGAIVEHLHFGKGVVVDTASEFYTIWFKTQGGTKTISRDFADIRLVMEGEAPTQPVITLADIEKALENILDQRDNDFQIVPMANKWNDGTIVLQPKDKSLQNKEIPIETFFHKIVMIRDRMRLIEQKINAHKVLTDEEKVDIQQYVTAVYGSLTTFNVLFKETIHQFKGAGKD